MPINKPVGVEAVNLNKDDKINTFDASEDTDPEYCNPSQSVK